MKHIFALVNAVLISMALGGTYSFAAASTPWNGTAQTPAISGTTYVITAPEHLAWIAQQSRTDDFAGKLIRLDADLDLGGTQELPPSWEPIGSAATPFRGELDGNNHVIYNLYILNSFPTGAGLIAETGAEALVHNLGIAQGQIMTDATSNVGAFIGINRGRLHHCFNMAQIIAHNGDNIGGLIGTNYGKLEYAYNCGIITDANSHVGGLIGVNKSTATLNECYNAGYCKGAEHAGALFGLNEAAAANLTRIYFDQQVTRTYATGYGTADALDNTLYAIEKSATFFAPANPYTNRSEWECVTNGYYRYPRLKCFGNHEAARVSTNAILLDADNLPVERAEGVGAPMQGNLPRKSFKLLGGSSSVWTSSGEDASREGKYRVKDRKSENEDGNHEGNGGRLLIEAVNGKRRNDIAEEHRSRVSHKDLCGVEVIRQKAHARAEKRRTGYHDRGAGHDSADGKQRSRADSGDAAGKPVQSVDKVDGVRQSNDPQQGQGIGEPAEVEVVPENVDVLHREPEAHGDQGCNELQKEFELCFEIENVVKDAQNNDRKTAEPNAPAFRRHFREKQHGNGKSEKDRNSAAKRHRLCVHPAVVLRHIEGTDMGSDRLNDRGRNKGYGNCRQKCDQRPQKYIISHF